jgi:hypothetical protein
MTAEVLRASVAPITDPDEQTVPGTWTTNQDPITGEIINNWVPGQQDNPDTPDVDESEEHVVIPCFVQGIYNTGIRAAGADEQFGAEYFNIEFVKMWIPANVSLTKRDRVTNIKDSLGNIVWRDEEYDDRPTVYNVQGVTPRFDPWNRPQDQFVLLKKAD